MTTQPKHNITAEGATDLLKDGRLLTDVYVDGELKIETNDTWNKEEIFKNCAVDCFSESVMQFDKPVKLINCYFINCQFIFTYFFGGLILDTCTFDNYLDSQAGGHNKTENPVIITNNNFQNFINFVNYWYENEVIISNNKFYKGTNLLGKPHNIAVAFDREPIIKDNIGHLDLGNQGEESE